CHPDPTKRYVAGLWYGVLNLIIGALAGVLVVFFLALPKALITILAGLALLGAILSNISNAFHADFSVTDREAALVTFMTCASGVTLWQMGSAFWGIVLGCLTYAVFHWRVQHAHK
ncbi:MAG: benzoate/H(+) symporter BenE family transporter, partial [Burkholderiales bacterium]|nr:benzoate/H(+) symporter BenE family transporter [Burkholderiales bacterium]